jgi:hypothetical protein
MGKICKKNGKSTAFAELFVCLGLLPSPSVFLSEVAL